MAKKLDFTNNDTRDGLYPLTAANALRKWDKGESVCSIELGGLGPGYEQAIQVLVFELIRDNTPKTIPTFEDADAPTSWEQERWAKWGDETVRRIDKSVGGFSGAQVGAAKKIAYIALKHGWAAMLNSCENDRHIQVSNFWPQANAEAVAVEGANE